MLRPGRAVRVHGGHFPARSRSDPWSSPASLNARPENWSSLNPGTHRPFKHLSGKLSKSGSALAPVDRSGMYRLESGRERDAIAAMRGCRRQGHTCYQACSESGHDRCQSDI